VSTRALACAAPTADDTDVAEQALEAGPPHAADASDAGETSSAVADGSDGRGSTPDDAGDADAHPTTIVVLYDTYAQALYFDGTYGPTTGTIRAVDVRDHVLAGTDQTYDFWHGHNGVLHQFTLTAANFADLVKKKRVNLVTTVVDGHQHDLFVDPVDLTWRVPGAPPVTVAVPV
jgi:hypothetical protein